MKKIDQLFLSRFKMLTLLSLVFCSVFSSRIFSQTLSSGEFRGVYIDDDQKKNEVYLVVEKIDNDSNSFFVYLVLPDRDNSKLKLYPYYALYAKSDEGSFYKVCPLVSAVLDGYCEDEIKLSVFSVGGAGSRNELRLSGDLFRGFNSKNEISFEGINGKNGPDGEIIYLNKLQEGIYSERLKKRTEKITPRFVQVEMFQESFMGKTLDTYGISIFKKFKKITLGVSQSRNKIEQLSSKHYYFISKEDMFHIIPLRIKWSRFKAEKNVIVIYSSADQQSEVLVTPLK